MTNNSLELLERQKEVLLDSLSEMFIYGTIPYVEGGEIKHKWKKDKSKKTYEDGLLMLDYLNTQIKSNLLADVQEKSPEPIIRPIVDLYTSPDILNAQKPRGPIKIISNAD